MAKYIILFSTIMMLQLCIEAAPNSDHAAEQKSDETPTTQEAGPKLDNLPNEVAKETDDKTSQGQRQKRFYNYFNFGFTPYDSYNPYFVKRDQSQDTGVYGSEDPFSQIHNRVLAILRLTKQQAHSPPPFPHFPVPSFIPIFYIPQAGCGCTSDDAGPVYDEGPNTDASKAPDTTTTTHPTIVTPPPTNDIVTDRLSPTDDTNNPLPDFPTRSSDFDEDDGVRPISLEPVKPKRPLSKPPPPVEHGSSQAGESNKESDVAAAPPPVLASPPQSNVATNEVPTLCDGAVLTCCHRPEPTYECFEMQGCPNPPLYDSPCDAKLILSVIRKFQYYYANRLEG